MLHLMNRVDIPHRPEAVTAAWLTEALGPSVPDVQVTGVEVLDQHSGTTDRPKLAETRFEQIARQVIDAMVGMALDAEDPEVEVVLHRELDARPADHTVLIVASQEDRVQRPVLPAVDEVEPFGPGSLRRLMR